jgi:hypothetical protein
MYHIEKSTQIFMGDNTVMPFHVLGVLVKPFDCFHRQQAREIFFMKFFSKKRFSTII